MFRKSMIVVSVICALFLLLVCVRPVNADGQRYQGSVGLQTPIGMTPQHASENTPQLVWSLKLNNVVEKFSVFTSGQFSLRDNAPFAAESKYQVGIEHPLFGNLVAYSFFERRFEVDQNRYVAGVRYNFGGKF